MQWGYAIPLVIWIIALPVTLSLLSADLAKLLGQILLALSLAIGASIFVIKRIGWRRFRALWNEEHGLSGDAAQASSG